MAFARASSAARTFGGRGVPGIPMSVRADMGWGISRSTTPISPPVHGGSVLEKDEGGLRRRNAPSVPDLVRDTSPASRGGHLKPFTSSPAKAGAQRSSNTAIAIPDTPTPSGVARATARLQRERACARRARTQLSRSEGGRKRAQGLDLERLAPSDCISTI